jgi:hypothetical protein
MNSCVPQDGSAIVGTQPWPFIPGVNAGAFSSLNQVRSCLSHVGEDLSSYSEHPPSAGEYPAVTHVYQKLLFNLWMLKPVFRWIPDVRTLEPFVGVPGR